MKVSETKFQEFYSNRLNEEKNAHLANPETVQKIKEAIQAFSIVPNLKDPTFYYGPQGEIVVTDRNAILNRSFKNFSLEKENLKFFAHFVKEYFRTHVLGYTEAKEMVKILENGTIPSSIKKQLISAQKHVFLNADVDSSKNEITKIPEETVNKIISQSQINAKNAKIQQKKPITRAKQVLQRVGIVSGMVLGVALLVGFLTSPLIVPLALIAAGVSGAIALGVALGLAVVTAPFDCLLAALGKGGSAQSLHFPDGAVDKAKKACNQSIEEMKKLEGYKTHFEEEKFLLFIQSNPWFNQLNSLKQLEDFYQLYKTNLQIDQCKNKLEIYKQELQDAENAPRANEIESKEKFAALGKELKKVETQIEQLQQDYDKIKSSFGEYAL